MSRDNPYQSLLEPGSQDDTHWAFGTGFYDPLSGVDSTVPDGVAGDDLAAYCLMLGDDALIMSHRLQEWCTRGPELEDEVAVANIALDLLGQARLLYARAGTADGTGRAEDWYAFRRDAHAFHNVRLVEPADGDFAALMARLLVFACFRLEVLDALAGSLDPVLAAVAAKGVKEVTYHRHYAARWVVRLGDGTELSRRRMQHGLERVWSDLGELFAPHRIELRLATCGVAVDVRGVRAQVETVLADVLQAATLRRPDGAATGTHDGTDDGAEAGTDDGAPAGREGRHTTELGELLAELQSVARAHPEATW
jgi:ring-1,2-phenylacetyl-CoA epoxidase subunit PaaC